jgi:two-component system cell cycle sensor histidine kinase/response regulator CckA
MLAQRLGLKAFIGGSLAIIVAVFGVGPVVLGALLPGLAPVLGKCLLAAGGAAASLLVMTLAVLVIRRHGGEAQTTELKFRSLLDAAPDAVVIMDRAGRVALVNVQAERLFGCARAAMLGQPVERWLRRRGRDDRHREMAATDFSSLGSGRAGEGPQFVGRRADGREIALEISFSPLETPGGPLTINILRDVTARERAERRRATRNAVRRILAEAPTAQDLARRLLAALGGGLAWEAGALWLVDRQANVLRRVEAWRAPGRGPAEPEGDGTLAPGVGLPGRVWLMGEPVWRPEGGAELVGAAVGEPAGPGALAFPIAVGNEVLGVIDCRSRGFEEADEPLLDTLAGVGGLVGQFLQRQQAEEAARRLAAIVESSDEAILGEALDGTITSWNKGAERLFGYASEEAVGRSVALLFPPAAADELPGVFDTVRQGRAVEVAETERLCKSGRRVCVAVTVSPVRDAAGKVVGASAIYRDITERKRAESLLAAEKQVLEQIARGASLPEVLEVLARAGDGQAAGVCSCILLLDRDGGRFRLGAAPALPVAFRRALDGLTADPKALACGAAAAKGQFVAVADVAADPLWEGFRPPTLEHGLHACWSAPILSAEGRVLGTFDLYHREPRAPRPVDVQLMDTLAHIARIAIERHQADEALRKTEEQFRQAQKMEAVGRLASGIAHDFNNLLTVITASAQLLLETQEEGSTAGPLLEEIVGSADRAAGLTRQLLAFSRKQVLRAEVLDLNVLISDMDKMLRRVIGEDIVLCTEQAEVPCRVKADRGQVEQVVMNLVVNARDAMPDGGRVTIETRLVDLDETYARLYPEVRPGAYVLLAVTDTGCGMDEVVKARVFEPFFTTKEVGKGTGLGLAMVYGTVKQSGGHIAVYSEPGKGSTFKVYLPCSAAEEVALPSHGSVADVPDGTGTVLLVEDEDRVRSITSRILQGKGYTVLEARHGGEALHLLEQTGEDVQLIVTDVVMPTMNGPELVQRLQAQRPDLKVLFLSGYTDSAIFRHGLLDEGKAFLQKPFTPGALTRKVHEVLCA